MSPEYQGWKLRDKSIILSGFEMISLGQTQASSFAKICDAVFLPEGEHRQLHRWISPWVKVDITWLTLPAQKYITRHIYPCNLYNFSWVMNWRTVGRFLCVQQRQQLSAPIFPAIRVYFPDSLCSVCSQSSVALDLLGYSSLSSSYQCIMQLDMHLYLSLLHTCPFRISYSWLFFTWMFVHV